MVEGRERVDFDVKKVVEIQLKVSKNMKKVAKTYYIYYVYLLCTSLMCIYYFHSLICIYYVHLLWEIFSQQLEKTNGMVGK